MEPIELPSPSPTPITELSPSLANQLLSCPLRTGYGRDPAHKGWRRPSTYSELGVVAHAVTEAAFKGTGWAEDPAALRVILERIWTQEIERSVARLAAAWSPASPPPPREWPGYSLTRARTIRRAMKVLTGPKVPISKETTGTGIEVELRDPVSGLFGRADRIERDGESTRVVDLKTGLHQDEPTEFQRRQLLLYAVLVHRTTGEWPASIAIEDASGNRYSQPLDPNEAEAALTDVQVSVSAFNDAIGDGSLLSLAHPDPESCRWCEFRLLCRPFWESVTNEWDQRAVLGSILNSGDSNEGAHVSIAVVSPRELSGVVLHISGLPTPLPPDAKSIAIVDWKGTPETGDVRARWSTRIRTW